MAFTDYETEQLRKALLKETRHCAVTLGMKKTSVEQLTKAVGIAKGSFYKFYESKEMLFFAVLEGIHAELYGVADHALSETDGLPPSERAADQFENGETIRSRWRSPVDFRICLISIGSLKRNME